MALPVDVAVSIDSLVRHWPVTLLAGGLGWAILREIGPLRRLKRLLT